jgi:hypothetical protein
MCCYCMIGDVTDQETIEIGGKIVIVLMEASMMITKRNQMLS